jgi:hypothetical protein
VTADPHELIGMADVALSTSKESGRNRRVIARQRDLAATRSHSRPWVSDDSECEFAASGRV